MRNGKRILSLALLVLLVVLLMPVAAHADPPQDGCPGSAAGGPVTTTHSWVIESDTATCTKDGKRVWRCTKCGKTYGEKSPALGHDFGNGRVTREATCTKEGEKTWTCSRCGATKTDTFPAKGHSPVSIPAVAATCTATGLTEGSQCSVCGEILKAQETVPATGHTPAAIPAVAPTCTETGLTEGEKCSVCGEILKAQETVAATGHAWSDWATQIEATCTDGGIEIRTCLSCGTEETRSTDALGHAPVTIPGSDPTCEADGYTDGETCDRCGFVLKEREVLPAIGHEWDEGQVTREPQDFTPGVRTFTCQHDPSHTRTEEIDPAPWLFASFTGSFPDFTTFDLATKDLTPLTITEQPQDGAVTRHGGDSLTLHVAATGGTGDYTYEWKYRPTYNSTIGNIISWTFLHTSGKQTEPVFEAYDGNMRYWCVVTDSAGNTAQSETAIVSYKLGIAKQPDNANLQPTGKATLSCLAEDGSGSYSYRWIDNQDNEIDVGSSIDVTEIGDYMCIATDDLTGETASSYVATVYDTEPFRLMTFTGDGEHHPDGSGMLKAGFAGGVQPYEIWWDKDGEAIESEDAEVDDYIGAVVYNATIGNYTVHAVDAMGEVITATSHRTAPKLTIVEQPVGGIIPKGKYLPLRVTVSDGEAPYHFQLYWNGEKFVGTDTDNPYTGYSAWESGEYYIHIEDSQGRQADSDVVTCENAVFRIKDQTESASLAKPGDTASLFVEAEGGIEPYTYLWSLKIGNTRYKVGESRTISADKPGEYLCRVVDTDGEMIHSKTILVGYTGDTPIITKQPVGGNLVYGGSVYLSCAAVSGSGGELRYEWERSTTAEGSRPSWGKASRSGGSTWYMEASATGAYHCRVTDTKTGKYTFTQTVFVTRELSATAEGHRDNMRPDYYYTLHIQGGAAPYTVKVYLITERSEFNPKTILWRTYTVATEEEANNFEEQIPDFWNYSYYYAKDNEWIRSFETTKAFAIITDAEGKTTRVDIR